jgi:hypothetical protein
MMLAKGNNQYDVIVFENVDQLVQIHADENFARTLQASLDGISDSTLAEFEEKEKLIAKEKEDEIQLLRYHKAPVIPPKFLTELEEKLADVKSTHASITPAQTDPRTAIETPQLFAKETQVEANILPLAKIDESIETLELPLTSLSIINAPKVEKGAEAKTTGIERSEDPAKPINEEKKTATPATKKSKWAVFVDFFKGLFQLYKRLLKGLLGKTDVFTQ